MTNNASFPLSPSGGGVRLNSISVAPGATIYNPPLTKLYVGGAGNITMVSPQTGIVTLTAVPAGSWISDVAVLQVTAATATNLIGYF